MDGPQRHEGDQQHRHSDDQDSKVSILSDGDKADERDNEYSSELKGHTGIRGRQEHIDHLIRQRANGPAHAEP